MAPSDNKQLTSLVRLAREKAQENRRILLENITDLFLSPVGRLSEQEAALMAEIVWRLVHDIEMAVRQELAETLSSFTSQPPAVVAALTGPGVEMTRLTLARQDVVRDETLVELAKYRAYEYLLAEARQEAFVGLAAERILAEGPGQLRSFIDELTRHEDAILAIRAREYVVAETRRLDRFGRPALARGELPGDLARKLVWAVAGAVQRYLLERVEAEGGIEVGQLDDMVEETALVVFEEIGRELGRPTAAERLIERLAVAAELNLDLLTDALQRGYVGLFVAGMARLCHLDRLAAQRVVFDQTGEAFALACKAAGYGREEFESIYLWTRLPRNLGRSGAIARQLVRLYDTVSEKTAKRSLSYWNRNAEYLSALERARN